MLSEVSWPSYSRTARCSVVPAVTFLSESRGAGELYSLVRFLRIFPYAYYFCRKAGGCDCRSLDHKFRARRACHTCGCALPAACFPCSCLLADFF